MEEKKRDISSIGSSFLLMAAGVLFIYSLTGMTAAHLEAKKERGSFRGLHFEKEYPDEANGITHVSVIYRGDI
ncbi:MAG: hypothetical protein E7386_00400 [Ruminococcaceae bacterium]|nr:hypothetical protein [Oscillospiraceae bacterium]